jgi:very-short-patch-repair endonuclease
MGNANRSVVDFARRNGGVITRDEAIALGMTPTTLQRRVHDGILIRLRRGVFALPGTPDPHILDLHAACRKLGAVVSHQSAAYIHGLDRPSHVKPTVSVLRNRTKDLIGVIVHQLNDLTESQICQIDGLTVTTPERTIVDLAAVISDRRLARILDKGLAARIVNLPELSDLFAELGRRGKPGTARMRKLLDARGGDFIAPESELERRLSMLIADAGLHRPKRQFKAPWLRPVNGRVDLAYPDERLVIEGDSRRWHMLADAFETDRIRDNAAQLAGWRILRFTWEEITQNPERVVSTIRHALART